MTSKEINRASFRDPSGFVFREGGRLFRQINRSYRPAYEKLMSSGLYNNLVQDHLLIPHQETIGWTDDCDGLIIQPAEVAFISYPYEWCFSQLKDAALATLEIARRALSHGMILKDASAYNIQFHQGKAILIDTCSFDLYHQNQPWPAYRQFCQHFLAPLALAAHVDIRLLNLLANFMDGIPLDLASRLLPAKTKVDMFGLGLTIHAHARLQKRYQAGQPARAAPVKVTRTQLDAILQGLAGSVEKLKWSPTGTEWGDYYRISNYSQQAEESKKKAVGDFLEKVHPEVVLDLGANNGLYSREAARRGSFTIACDVDPAAVEQNYQAVKKNSELNLLPLVIDLNNPSPDLGWAGQERDSFLRRGKADLVMALALIHHLAIGNNLPLGRIAEWLAGLGQWGIVEFIPKQDSQVQRLLASRTDIFTTYDESHFMSAFSNFFSIVDEVLVKDSQRKIFLLRNLEQ